MSDKGFERILGVTGEIAGSRLGQVERATLRLMEQIKPDDVVGYGDFDRSNAVDQKPIDAGKVQEAVDLNARDADAIRQQMVPPADTSQGTYYVQKAA